jgi:hypothetical protein
LIGRVAQRGSEAEVRWAAVSCAEHSAGASRELDGWIRNLGTEIWGPDETNLMPSSSVLSRLKDGKAVGVVDEDAPEKPRTQDTIEPLYIGALLGGSTEEGYAGQLE